MSESFYFNYKIKNKQKTEKIVRLNSKQKRNKQITQKHKNTKRLAKKNLSMMILHPPLN